MLVGSRPRFAEFTADGSQLWVRSEVAGTVSVIDPKTRQIIKTIGFEIPGIQPETIQPVGIRILKDGSKAFVALGPANHVAVIDAKRLEVERYLLVGQRVWQLAFTPDEKLLFVTNGNSNDVSVIDVPTLKVVKSMPVGSAPWGVAISQHSIGRPFVSKADKSRGSLCGATIRAPAHPGEARQARLVSRREGPKQDARERKGRRRESRTEAHSPRRVPRLAKPP